MIYYITIVVDRQDTSTDAVVQSGRHERQRQEDVRPQDLKSVYNSHSVYFLFSKEEKKSSLD